MKRSVKSLIGYTVAATYGEIGKVKEFYFDDTTWTIQYLILDTGNWLTGRVVLISPQALLTPDWENKTFPVNLTKEQIWNCPHINTAIPVSRQEENKLHNYYSMVAYWGGGYGGALAPGTMIMGMPRTELTEQLSPDKEAADKHLRSRDTVSGYKIHATDDQIGKVEDFIIDDNTWTLDFIVVDTGSFFNGKSVLISPRWIKGINWETSTVIINASVEEVKNSPDYDTP